MIHILRSFAAKVWFTLLLLIVIAGATAMGIRLLLPMADSFRAEVQAELNSRSPVPIRIGSLSARLRGGIRPELTLREVDLLDPDTKRPQMHFKAVHLGLDFLDSLIAGEISGGSVTVAGTRLVLKRRSDGSVVLAGFEGVENKGEDAGAAAMFFAQRRLRLTDSEVYWENQAIGAPPLRFSDVDVDFRNDGSRHQVSLSARLGEAGELGSITAAADLTGETTLWNGDIYLKGDGLALANILTARLPAGYQIKRGETNVEIWSRWRDGRMKQLSGNVEVNDLEVEPASIPEVRRLELDFAGADFVWNARETGWRLDTENLRLTRNGKSWPATRFSLETSHDVAGNLRLAAGAEYLSIEDLLTVVRLFPVDANKLVGAMNGARPGGEVRNLGFVYETTTQGEPSWATSGEVSGFFSSPWGKIPGVNGLDFTFRSTDRRGFLELGSRNVVIEFAHLFRDPLKIEYLNGDLIWERDPETGFSLSTDLLQARNEDIRTESRLRLNLPVGDSSPVLDMQTDFFHGNAAHTSRYLPVGIMPDRVVAWLDRSIIGGDIVAGSFIFRGAVRDFPFKKNEGRFEVLFGVERMLLDYDESWPRLEEVSAEVRFLDNSLGIRIFEGKILESEVSDATARIASLKTASPVEIIGTVRGPFADGLRILRESPLAEQQGKYVERMRVEGDSLVTLDFAVPLRRDQQFRLDGGIEWRKASVRFDFDRADFDLMNVKGKLGFTHEGITARDIRAKLFDIPVSIDIDTRAGDRGSRGFTRISARIPVTAEQLEKQFPSSFWQYIAGRSELNLRLDVGHRESKDRDIRVGFKLSSDLRGTQVDLPAPLEKPADQQGSFIMEGVLDSSPKTHLVLAYGEAVSAALSLVEQEGVYALERCGILLGPGRATLPDSPGLRLTGAIPSLDLQAWVERLGEGNEGKGLESSPMAINEVLLKVDELPLFGHVFHNASIGANREAGTWSVDMKARELIGRAEFAEDILSRPVVVRLDHLDLLFDVEHLGLDEFLLDKDEKEEPGTDPRDLPALDMEVTDFRLNEQSLGRLILKTERQPNGLNLKTVKLDGEKAVIDARGYWHLLPRGVRTGIDAEGRSPNLGALLRGLGFASNLEAAPIRLDAHLTWPDSPTRFSLGNLSGDLRFDIGAGRLLEVEPGVGRVFGLFSLGALQRRLSLDFTDLVKKGYAFDKIEGSFFIDEGSAYTNDLFIEGPAARVDIAGRTDLVQQEYDQTVTVIPRVSTSIPVAGALAGGPAVGAALLLAQQILGKEVDQITRYQYSVGGTWDKPEFKREATDGGWSLSRLFESIQGKGRTATEESPQEEHFVH